MVMPIQLWQKEFKHAQQCRLKLLKNKKRVTMTPILIPKLGQHGMTTEWLVLNPI